MSNPAKTPAMNTSEPTTPTNPEPLPCPFCGTVPRIEMVHPQNSDKFLRCKPCGIGWFTLAAWNTRADGDADKRRFQERVEPWLIQCFGGAIAYDATERNHRFLEEALELVQTCGCTQSEAHQLVDYVYSRPLGEKEQEAGGVMVTLAALCLAQKIDMHKCGETELARIGTKIDKIRAKQAAKPKHSPLPGYSALSQDNQKELSAKQIVSVMMEGMPAGPIPAPAKTPPVDEWRDLVRDVDTIQAGDEKSISGGDWSGHIEGLIGLTSWPPYYQFRRRRAPEVKGEEKDPRCTCIPKLLGSMTNCPVHGLSAPSKEDGQTPRVDADAYELRMLQGIPGLQLCDPQKAKWTRIETARELESSLARAEQALREAELEITTLLNADFEWNEEKKVILNERDSLRAQLADAQRALREANADKVFIPRGDGSYEKAAPSDVAEEYRHLWKERDSLRTALTASRQECERLKAERDAAVSESNRRDKKWMEGIKMCCGTEIRFDMPCFENRHIPSLEDFVKGLRADRDRLQRELEEAKASDPVAILRGWLASAGCESGNGYERRPVPPEFRQLSFVHMGALANYFATARTESASEGK